MTKVTIIGAGAVGSAIAYAAQIRGVCQEIALYDLNARKVNAEVLDLNHGMQFTPMVRIIGGDDLEVARDSDLIVITAGAKQKPGQTRLDLASANVAMCRTLVPKLVALAPDSLLLVVTNPVDVVTLAALEASGLPPNRVFGSGTVLDSSRLRYLIAERARVAVQNVHAYIAGEHGDSEVPLWSTATIGGLSLNMWDEQVTGQTPVFDEAGRREIKERVVGAAYEIIEGKGATSLAIGLAVSRILEAVLNNERRVLPVSSLIKAPSEFAGICLSMPSIVNREGVRGVLVPPLDDAEESALRESSAQVKAVCRDLGLKTD